MVATFETSAPATHAATRRGSLRARAAIAATVAVLETNPDEGLRQGMPVTAEIDLNPAQ